MNAKTQAQINRMKEQTIGVEVEMNSITRKAAAKLAADFFGTNRSEYTAHRNGYETYSAWDAQGREWKFQRDCSISGPDSEKCELVTPILHYADIETLQELIRRLRKAGAKSDYTRGCGVHIHIGAAGHTPQSLRNLANLMASHETLIAEAIKVDSSRMNRYCRTVNPNFLQQLNKKKPTTMAQLADIWYGAQGCDYGRTHHYNDSRYHMLNLHATFTKGAVEFRLFQFDAPADGKQNGLHAGQLKSYIQLCLALSQMAKTVRTASPKPQQNENPKYAMRTWLLRLGFIGDEFKTARELLTKRLDGDAAFREGRRPEASESADGGLSVVEGNFGKEYFYGKTLLHRLRQQPQCPSDADALPSCDHLRHGKAGRMGASVQGQQDRLLPHDREMRGWHSSRGRLGSDRAGRKSPRPL